MAEKKSPVYVCFRHHTGNLPFYQLQHLLCLTIYLFHMAYFIYLFHWSKNKQLCSLVSFSLMVLKMISSSEALCCRYYCAVMNSIFNTNIRLHYVLITTAVCNNSSKQTNSILCAKTLNTFPSLKFISLTVYNFSSNFGKYGLN